MEESVKKLDLTIAAMQVFPLCFAVRRGSFETPESGRGL